MLLHILLFDKAYHVTYWLNYSELRARLRRRYHAVETPESEFRLDLSHTSLGVRLGTEAGSGLKTRGALLQQYGPRLTDRSFEAVELSRPAGAGFFASMAQNMSWGLERLVCLSASVGSFVSGLFGLAIRPSLAARVGESRSSVDDVIRSIVQSIGCGLNRGLPYRGFLEA
jgi:hypothetical protein